MREVKELGQRARLLLLTLFPDRTQTSDSSPGGLVMGAVSAQGAEWSLVKGRAFCAADLVTQNS